MMGMWSEGLRECERKIEKTTAKTLPFLCHLALGDCVTEYMLIYHSREQRAHVRKRDKGVCNHCGKVSRKWDVDHINPLVEQKNVKAKDLDWSYYSLDNLQTLCKKCHRIKTNSEVKLRGKGKLKYKTHKFIGESNGRK